MQAKPIFRPPSLRATFIPRLRRFPSEQRRQTPPIRAGRLRRTGSGGCPLRRPRAFTLRGARIRGRGAQVETAGERAERRCLRAAQPGRRHWRFGERPALPDPFLRCSLPRKWSSLRDCDHTLSCLFQERPTDQGSRPGQDALRGPAVRSLGHRPDRHDGRAQSFRIPECVPPKAFISTRGNPSHR